MSINIYELAEKIDEIGGVEKFHDLIEENENLKDKLFEAHENLKCAEDQNHYFKLMCKKRDEAFELRKEIELYKSLVKAIKLGEKEK